MNKIYIATVEHQLEGLEQDIKDLKKNVELIMLNSKEQVVQALSSEFRLLIVLADLVDASQWPNSLSGHKEVYILNESQVELTNPKPYVHVYHSYKVLKGDLLENLLSNLNIRQEKHDVTEDKTEEANNPTKPAETRENQNRQQKNNQKVKVLSDSDFNDIEPNKFPPLKMNPYPVDDLPRAIIEEYKKDFDFYFSGSGNATTIGVWSPAGTGTTTFVISFALFMAKANKVSVIEMPNHKYSIYSRLAKYGPIPKDWESMFELYKLKYGEGFGFDKHEWKYGGVNWIPIGPHDYRLPVDSDADEFHQFDSMYLDKLYRKTKADSNLVLVDLPSILDEHARYVMPKLDQLWILLNERMGPERDWHNFIHKDSGVKKTGLVFVGAEKLAEIHNTPQKMADHLDVELLATIPYLDREILNNYYYENIPPNKNRILRKALEPVYFELAKRLVGEEQAGLLLDWKTKLVNSLKKQFSKNAEGNHHDVVDSN